jgi:hypothetical protein
MEIRYRDSIDEIEGPLIQGSGEISDFSVFDLGSDDGYDLKAILSIKCEEEVGDSPLTSNKGMREILYDVGNPELAKVREHEGRVHLMSDLSSAAPGSIAEEFSDVFRRFEE